MPPFAGFPVGKVRLTPIPVTFFTELLPEIDNLSELKVTLYSLWFLDRQEGPIRFICYKDFTEDQRLMQGLGNEEKQALANLLDGLQRAEQRGTLLRAQGQSEGIEETFYLLNSPRGRAALKAYQQGAWSPDEQSRAVVAIELEKPNIYRLYEENIGPLTPLIADALRDAEETYPPEWIDDAIRKAVQANARSWRYMEAILKSRQKEGRDGTNRRGSQKGSQRYLEDEFADHIEH